MARGARAGEPLANVSAKGGGAPAPSRSCLRAKPFQSSDSPVVSPAATGEVVQVGFAEGVSQNFTVRVEDRAVVLSAADHEAGLSVEACWSLADWAFRDHPDCTRLIWRNVAVPKAALSDGLILPRPCGYETWQSMFWQLPAAWLCGEPTSGYPLSHTLGQDTWCPVRPPKPEGTVYRRYDTRLGQCFSLRTLDIEQDLGRFNRWQNTPRVRHFWEEGGDLTEHRRYLEKQAADPHVLTLIGCFDEEPFAYFEVYWAKEDRIAPYYPATEFDRGIHMLVGEEAHRGPHKVACWLPSLVHYLFLDDCRTQTIVSEPRADNARMIGYLQKYGFHRARNIVFPHKEAALMMLSRQRFFERGPFLHGRPTEGLFSL